MDNETTLRAYTLIGCTSQTKIAEALDITRPTLKLKLAGSSEWKFAERVMINDMFKKLSNSLNLNQTIKSL